MTATPQPEFEPSDLEFETVETSMDITISPPPLVWVPDGASGTWKPQPAEPTYAPPPMIKAFAKGPQRHPTRVRSIETVGQDTPGATRWLSGPVRISLDATRWPRVSAIASRDGFILSWCNADQYEVRVPRKAVPSVEMVAEELTQGLDPALVAKRLDDAADHHRRWERAALDLALDRLRESWLKRTAIAERLIDEIMTVLTTEWGPQPDGDGAWRVHDLCARLDDVVDPETLIFVLGNLEACGLVLESQGPAQEPTSAAVAKSIRRHARKAGSPPPAPIAAVLWFRPNMEHEAIVRMEVAKLYAAGQR
jgi:hypothetical protein